MYANNFVPNRTAGKIECVCVRGKSKGNGRVARVEKFGRVVLTLYVLERRGWAVKQNYETRTNNRENGYFSLLHGRFLFNRGDRGVQET